MSSRPRRFFGASDEGGAPARAADRGAGCIFCTGASEGEQSHARERCPTFKALKAQTTRQSYVEPTLKPAEAHGFSAAGVLLWRRIDPGVGVEFLLAREDRAGFGVRLNFIGGKRLSRGETAAGTAIRKVEVETGGALDSATVRRMTPSERSGFALVHWSAKSKYALFLYELTSPNDVDVDVRSAGREGAKRLEWVPRAKLYDPGFVEREVHRYAAEMLRGLQEEASRHDAAREDQEVLRPPGARSGGGRSAAGGRHQSQRRREGARGLWPRDEN